MIGILATLFAAMVVLLGVALVRRGRQAERAEVPQGYTVLAADLGPDGRGPLTLRDDEYGLVCKVDLLLESPDGAIVPVEYKRAGASFTPGRARPSHILQLGASMLACQGDGRIGRRPAFGWLRYVDGAGQLVPGGQVAVQNTPELRERVLNLLQPMRRALVDPAEVHRDHRSVQRCLRCALRFQCGEQLAA